MFLLKSYPSINILPWSYKEWPIWSTSQAPFELRAYAHSWLYVLGGGALSWNLTHVCTWRFWCANRLSCSKQVQISDIFKACACFPFFAALAPHPSSFLLEWQMSLPQIRFQCISSWSVVPRISISVSGFVFFFWHLKIAVLVAFLGCGYFHLWNASSVLGGAPACSWLYDQDLVQWEEFIPIHWQKMSLNWSLSSGI